MENTITANNTNVTDSEATAPPTMDKTERRRIARKAKKERMRKEKDEKKEVRMQKKQRIVENIRAQRAEQKVQRKQGVNVQMMSSSEGCWRCGSKDHTKQNCPNPPASNYKTVCVELPHENTCTFDILYRSVSNVENADIPYLNVRRIQKTILKTPFCVLIVEKQDIQYGIVRNPRLETE